MRVTLMGTGWGNIIRPAQKGASVFVELGNGDFFVFDVGPGSGINYNVMQVPASIMTEDLPNPPAYGSYLGSRLDVLIRSSG